MQVRKRYTRTRHSDFKIAQWRKEFFDQAGPSLGLMIEMFANVPGAALVIKDANGRIMHTNHYNAQISGWASPEDTIGYTSEELYPPDQAAVYAGRDREVMETGRPIVERIYGFVADRSTALNCVTVRPIIGIDGGRIGTATVYWRADSKLCVTNWYDPIRKAIVYLNEHYAEHMTIGELAAITHYSEAQFRRLFAQLMQMSPSDYITHVRINVAKTLLTTTDYSITDIAIKTGFYDHSHFIRNFRNIVGCTPKAYRHRTLRR